MHIVKLQYRISVNHPLVSLIVKIENKHAEIIFKTARHTKARLVANTTSSLASRFS